MDFTTLTSAVDFSTASTAVLAVFAAIVIVKIAKRGGREIMSAIGR